MDKTWVEEFKKMYQALNADNLELLSDWYLPDASFSDPLHQIQGIEQIQRYFSAMYANVQTIEFDYQWQLEAENELVIGWVMHLSHRKLNRGKAIQVEGVSRLQIKQGKVYRHQDFFDAGAMIYEQLPILRSVIKCLKQRAAG